MTYTCFDEFLREHGTNIEVFLTRLHNSNSSSDTLVELLNQEKAKGDLYDLIDFAFRWDQTPEGHFFWNEVHLEWIYALERNKIPEQPVNRFFFDDSPPRILKEKLSPTEEFNKGNL